MGDGAERRGGGAVTLVRRLLPVAAPVGGVLLLGVATWWPDDPPPPRRTPNLPPIASAPEVRAAPEPAAPPVDRPRCIASMFVRDLSRQLVDVRQAEEIAAIHRDHATPEVARAMMQALVEAAEPMPPSMARSRVLVVAADGLARLDQFEAARAALSSSRELPPPGGMVWEHERVDWRGEAARVAARLHDDALAQELAGDEPEALAELAIEYGLAADATRARALLDRIDASTGNLGLRMSAAQALATVGELTAAQALGDADPDDAVLISILIARTLTEQGRLDDAAQVLSTAVDRMPPTLPWSKRASATLAVARGLDDVGRPEAAAALREQVRPLLREHSDQLDAGPLWATLLDDLHAAGHREAAWKEIGAMDAAPLSDLAVAPYTRVRMLVREGSLDRAIETIRNSAGVPRALAYAELHARLRPPDPAVESRLDEGLRFSCPP